MSSIFHCDNPRCGKPLGVDHVILITTIHMRRFCTVGCVAEGEMVVTKQNLLTGAYGREIDIDEIDALWESAIEVVPESERGL